MARKYLRGLQYVTSTGGRDVPLFLRICYEFWGYCVNGTSSLTVPGGMPTTPTSAPSNFFEGTCVLATGNDGVTSSLGGTLTSISASFNTGMVGKYVTIWSPNSTSTDDSIYQIVSVPSSTQLLLTVYSGGTPDISTLKNNLTSRSSLNYRVIDPIASSIIALTGNYFVGTFQDAATINVGQAASQFQIFIRGTAPYGALGVVGSPGGTWTGSAFTGNSISERQAVTSTFNSGTSAGVPGVMTLIADRTSFMGHINSANSGFNGLYFYAMIPQRIYSQAQDQNPLTAFVGGNQFTNFSANDSQSNNFAMVGFDGVTRKSQLMTRNWVGDGQFGTALTVGPNLSSMTATQARTNKVVFTEALMSFSGTAGQYSLARAKLINIAFTSSNIPSFHLVGDNGQYIHVGNGTLWPWDGTILPYNLLPLGA